MIAGAQTHAYRSQDDNSASDAGLVSLLLFGESAVDEDMAFREKVLVVGLPRRGGARHVWGDISSDIECREEVTIRPQEPSKFDTTALPGVAVTESVMARERQRQALIELVRRFAVDGFSWNADHLAVVNDSSVKAARALLQILPEKSRLPRVCPDGEGAVMFLWEFEGSQTLVVVDGWKLHLVEAPGGPAARYEDDIAFDGSILPSELLRVIPKD